MPSQPARSWRLWISPKCILMLAVSGGASVFQLPVIGWFSQIGFAAAAMASFFGASPEASTACAATLLLVTFLSIVPVGLVWARFEHVSLRKITEESEDRRVKRWLRMSRRVEAPRHWPYSRLAASFAATRRGPGDQQVGSEFGVISN